MPVETRSLPPVKSERNSLTFATETLQRVALTDEWFLTYKLGIHNIKFYLELFVFICYAHIGKQTKAKCRNDHHLQQDMETADRQGNEWKRETGTSTTAIANLGKGENLTIYIKLRIYSILHCDIADICEVVENGEYINKKGGI